MIDNAKKNKIMNILNSGKSKFTIKDIEALSELTGGGTRSEHAINREQVYYDTLKTDTDAELVSKARERFISIYNNRLELNMIRNLLINRGFDLSKLDTTLEEYQRFVKNTPEENERYRL